MISLLIIIFFTALVSLLGSLQLGPVNLYVINSVLFKSRKEAIWVAVGGSLPEFIYCSMAVFATGLMQQSTVFLTLFKIAFILILFGIGIVFSLKKTSDINSSRASSTSNNHLNPLIKGFSLAAFNPQLLPFWMFVLVYFNSVKFLKVESMPDKISFILGSGLGAFGLLLLLIITVNKYKTKIVNYINNKLFFKFLALLFFGIAIQQIISLINNNYKA